MKIQIGTEHRMLSELARMCGGDLFGVDRQIRAICTDSREATADTLFVALRGEKTDGHAYIPDAVMQGCRAVLCEQRPMCSDVSGILVDKAVTALSDMAGAYLKCLSPVRVAVTGSVGKTTTKEILHSVLSQRFKTYKTEANYNSLIGMPLSVLGVGTQDQAAVFEMGMSARGEIETMSRIACPDVAIITSIGTSHMEYLGSRENIARAKLEILCGLRDGGLLIVDGDEPLLRSLPKGAYRVLRVCMSDTQGDVHAENVTCAAELDRMLFDVYLPDGRRWREMQIPGIGDAMVKDAMYGIAAAWSLGLTEQQIREGLMRYQTVGPRQRQICLGTVTVLEDCYNAAPESVRAALGALMTLAKGRGGRAIAVLGDMRELGQESIAWHRKIGALAKECGVSHLVTLGEMGAEIARGAKEAGMSTTTIRVFSKTEDVQEAARFLTTVIQPHDVVLIKASRALAAERVTQALQTFLFPCAGDAR